METATTLDLSALLVDTLGYTPGEFVSIGHDADGAFATAVTTHATAPRLVSTVPDTANTYFGVNPVAGPARDHSGRGTAKDVTRLAALHADLDVKIGACQKIDTAQQIVDELAAVSGTRPSAITHSGNGLHPYWPVADGDTLSNADAGALLKRWGRLVKAVAGRYGAQADSVFDLPRMLRAPGTTNCKAATNGDRGIPVVCYADTGGPLTVAEIADRLDEYGVYQEDGDTRTAEPISNPADWVYADETCAYVRTMIAGLSDDGPKPGNGRHQWFVKQAVRLECARMLGCLTEADHEHAKDTLATRLRHLRTLDPVAPVPDYEIDGAWAFGEDQASTKTVAAARAELGNHKHRTPHTAQLGMANTLAEQFSGKLLYINGIGWHRWDGKRFAPDLNGAARRAVHTMLRAEWKACAKLPADERKERAKVIARHETASAITGILTEAAALHEFSVTPVDVDADPWLLNCQNGTLDLRKGELREHDPADRITKVTNASYHPDVVGRSWRAFLDRVLPDEAVREYTRRLMSLGLFGEVNGDKQIAPIMTGTGANGKTTLTEAVIFALGDYAMPAEPNLLMARHSGEPHPTGIADLVGKRFVTVAETDRGARFALELLKRLTGGDTLKARFLYKNFFHFPPSHLLMLSTNHLPRVDDDTESVWRRIRVIPFGVEIPEDERDGQLGDRLQLEADGVLAWLMEGWRDYRSRGGLAPEPDPVKVATRDYKAESDPVSRFLEEECDLDGAQSSAKTHVLYARWETWANRNGCLQMSSIAFGRALDAKGYPADQNTHDRLRRRICLKQHAFDE